MKGNVYEAFINSEEGQRIAALGERAECWIDFHKGLDEETGESTETYALSYVKAMTNSGGKISGYIIIDVKRSFIEEILAKAKTCLGSLFFSEVWQGHGSVFVDSKRFCNSK